MRRAVVVGAVVALAALAGTARGMRPPIKYERVGGPAPATAPPPARLVIDVQGYPLVCGRPHGVLQVVFPAAVDLPRAMPAAAVHVNGRSAASVRVRGRSATISVATPRLTCYSIVPGRLRLVFTDAARIARPPAGRELGVTVRQGSQRYRAALRVAA